jgi:hypothetical protein
MCLAMLSEALTRVFRISEVPSLNLPGQYLKQATTAAFYIVFSSLFYLLLCITRYLAREIFSTFE